jgi:glutamyl-tRNA synthetase
VQVADFFFQKTLEYDPALLVQKGTTKEQIQAALTTARERIAALPDFEHGTLEESLRALAGELGLKTGQLFGALRVAVTGRTVAPPLFDTLAVLGRERVLERIGLAIGVLTGS